MPLLPSPAIFSKEQCDHIIPPCLKLCTDAPEATRPTIQPRAFLGSLGVPQGRAQQSPLLERGSFFAWSIPTHPLELGVGTSLRKAIPRRLD